MYIACDGRLNGRARYEAWGGGSVADGLLSLKGRRTVAVWTTVRAFCDSRQRRSRVPETQLGQLAVGDYPTNVIIISHGPYKSSIRARARLYCYCNVRGFCWRDDCVYPVPPDPAQGPGCPLRRLTQKNFSRNAAALTRSRTYTRFVKTCGRNVHTSTYLRAPMGRLIDRYRG